MKKYRTIVKKEKEAASIACDWCGKGSLKDGFFAGGSGTISFGYGSKRHDGDAYSLDICDKCFDKFIKPYVTLEDNYLIGKKGRRWLEKFERLTSQNRSSGTETSRLIEKSKRSSRTKT